MNALRPKVIRPGCLVSIDHCRQSKPAVLPVTTIEPVAASSDVCAAW